MTIAIKIGDDTSAVRGLLYFDVVTNFSESRNGSVTSFPLDFGASVGDHFIAKNPTYKLKGILSAADISGVSSKVKIGDSSPINAHAQPEIPSILDFAVGTAKLLPGSLSQFYKTAIPTVVDGGSVAPSQEQVKDTLREVMTGVQYNSTLKRYQNKMTTVVLYELDGANIKTQHTDLVITSFDIDEDAETGDCIPLSMSFEKIRFVTIEKVTPKSKAATKKTAKKGVKKPTTKECKTANSPYELKGIPEDPKIPNQGPSFNQLRLRGVLD
jgi:hypothetical protein